MKKKTTKKTTAGSGAKLRAKAAALALLTPRPPLITAVDGFGKPLDVTSTGTTWTTTVDLTDKQARFIAEYLVDLNAAAAARRAGYSAATADAIGWENLRKPEIAAAIAAGKAAQIADAGLTAARVLEELRRLAFVNVRDYFDGGTGEAKHPHQLTAEQGACLAGFEVLKRNLFIDDGHTDTIHKFKLWDKVKALELLAKHFALLVEQIDIKDTSADARVARLVAARKRTT
jgi:phage terminase small subunit